MKDYLRDNCEGIDAAVFSGDTLYDDDARKELKEYVDRWLRAINDHETTALREALIELVSIVRGECPSLLDEDSGGNARLSEDIDTILKRGELKCKKQD